MIGADAARAELGLEELERVAAAAATTRGFVDEDLGEPRFAARELEIEEYDRNV